MPLFHYSTFGRAASVILLTGVIASLEMPLGAAEAPRAYAAGTLPNDVRLGPLKDLDGYFPFQPAANREEWNRRAAQVRERMLVALGLSPMPPKTPLHAVIHGLVEREDYTVEKVYFESWPGFFVTGSLYRPKGAAVKPGKHAAVLSPHGHWANGRFYDNEKGIEQEIASGAERFADSGRSPLQARCVQLARMGCVVFHYDMLGNADSQQLSADLVHGFAKQRPEMNTVTNWGLYSPQAEAHLQSIMGLQTWNSIRALDFITSLPDVDSSRIAVTGASGGGTQTFILCAIDPRPAVEFPAVMVSTAMQGGCTCENASLLRVQSGNVEFAALFAPKPLGMTAADDWTKEMPSKGFPELQQHFRMMGAPENVQLTPLLHFGHNYNYVSRAAMYAWLNHHLKLGADASLVERDFKRLTIPEMSVWDDAHPKPESGPEFERKLLRTMWDAERKKIEENTSRSGGISAVERAGNRELIGRTLSGAGDVQWKMTAKEDRGNFLEMAGALRNTAYNEELPVVFLYPKNSKRRAVIWLASRGKSGLYNSDGTIRAGVKRLLDAGITVTGIDLLFQGEFTADGEPVTVTRTVKNPRESAAYTFGYNDSLAVQRAHDVLTVLSYMRNHDDRPKSISVVAMDPQVAPVAAAASAAADGAIQNTLVDTGGFRFGKLLALRDINFLPGGAKYGDLPAMLSESKQVWVSGEELNNSDNNPFKRYMKKVVLDKGSPEGRSERAIDWLLKQN
jgi:dienelactone hydrolase